MRAFFAFPFYVTSISFLFLAAIASSIMVGISSVAVLMSYWADQINPPEEDDDLPLD